MRGRKGQTAEVRAAKGNPGKRGGKGTAVADEQPALKLGVPCHLTAAGKRIWSDLAPKLTRINLLRETDLQSFSRYCDMLSEYWKVTRELRRKHYTYEAETTIGGKLLRLNPLFMVQSRLARQLDSMEDRFGLTPRARQEVLFRMSQQNPGLPFDKPSDDKPTPSAGPTAFLTNASAGGSSSVH